MKMIERSETIMLYEMMVQLSIIALGQHRALDRQDCTLPVVSHWTSRWDSLFKGHQSSIQVSHRT